MMSRLSTTVAALLLSGSLIGTAAAKCSNPTMAETVRATIASTCVCDAATNHGRYVSCVAHAVKAAVANGLPTNCKGTVTRCAARSSCGKPGFVTCCFASPGTCDVTTGLCQDGTTVCTTATQCPAVTKCRTKSNAGQCTAAGGSPGSGSCCDAACSLPPG
jgi:hypothetical protein